MLEPTVFRFLNDERRLRFPYAWNDDSLAALWLYNLHYFDDLNAEGSSERRDWHLDHIKRWVAENPPGQGTGWDAYPTSLRIVNWIKADVHRDVLTDEARTSLAVQTRWLRRNLEYHLLANHLLANFKALLFAGAYFEGPEADAWLRQGLKGLNAQLLEQVHEDGGHFERSPMYHAIILEDLLDCLGMMKAYGLGVPPQWENVAARMISWLAAMTHPDGGISFFNDAAHGIAAQLSALKSYAASLGLSIDLPDPESVVLGSSGFARLATGDAVVLCDVGSPGPAYQPGHAHAGTLSFEFSLFGRRLFVNSGTSEYGVSEERLRQRGTAAHNALVIDGKNSSEVWSGFRVARRAKVSDVAMHRTDGSIFLRASHDGYRRIYGGPVHDRRWHLHGKNLSLSDVVVGSGWRDLLIPLHLHPRVSVISTEKDLAILEHEGKAVRVKATSTPSVLRIEDATYHPEFGTSIPTKRIVIRARVELPYAHSVTISW